MRRIAAILILLVALAATAAAATGPAPDIPEPGSTEAIAAAASPRVVVETIGKTEEGRGRLIAFGFDPIHRTLTRSDFRLVWNALLNWNDLPEPVANPPAVHGPSPSTTARP